MTMSRDEMTRLALEGTPYGLNDNPDERDPEEEAKRLQGQKARKYQALEYHRLVHENGQALQRGVITPEEHQSVMKGDKSNFIQMALGLAPEGNDNTGGVLETIGDVLSIGNYAMASISKSTIEDPLVDLGWVRFGSTPSSLIKNYRAKSTYMDLFDDYEAFGEEGSSANFWSGLGADILVDPLNVLTLGVGTGTKVSVKTGAKEGVRAAGSLTLNRFGTKIYRLAAEDLNKSFVEANKVANAKRLADGRPPLHLLDEGVAAEWAEAIGSHMVENFDKFKGQLAQMSTSGKTGILARTGGAVKTGLKYLPGTETNLQAAETGLTHVAEMAARLRSGKAQSILTQTADDMFQETASVLRKEYGIYKGGSLTPLQKKLASAPLVGKGIEKFFDIFDRGWDASPGAVKSIRETKGLIDSETTDAINYYSSYFKDLTPGKGGEREQLTLMLEQAGMRDLAGEGATLGAYAPLTEKMQKAYDFARVEFEAIRKAEVAAGFDVGNIKGYVARIYKDPSARRLVEDLVVRRNGLHSIDTPNKFIQNRMIATINDVNELYGEGALVMDAFEILSLRKRASVNMIRSNELLVKLAKEEGVAASVVSDLSYGLPDGAIRGMMRKLADNFQEVMLVDQVFQKGRGNLSELGFKQGDDIFNDKMLEYLQLPREERLNQDWTQWADDNNVNEAARLFYKEEGSGDAIKGVPLPKTFKFDELPLETRDVNRGGLSKTGGGMREMDVREAFKMMRDPNHPGWRQVFTSSVGGESFDFDRSKNFLAALNRYTVSNLDAQLEGFMPQAREQVIKAWQQFDKRTKPVKMRSVGDSYFSDDALNAAYSEPGTKVVQLSPANFLKLAEPGVDDAKKARVDSLVENQTLLDEVPRLTVEIDEAGVAHVVDHDGRHRARAIAANGAETIPVRIQTNGKALPDKLISQDQTVEKIAKTEPGSKEAQVAAERFARNAEMEARLGKPSGKYNTVRLPKLANDEQIKSFHDFFDSLSKPREIRKLVGQLPTPLVDYAVKLRRSWGITTDARPVSKYQKREIRSLASQLGFTEKVLGQVYENLLGDKNLTNARHADRVIDMLSSLVYGPGLRDNDQFVKVNIEFTPNSVTNIGEEFMESKGIPVAAGKLGNSPVGLATDEYRTGMLASDQVPEPTMTIGDRGGDAVGDAVMVGDNLSDSTIPEVKASRATRKLDADVTEAQIRAQEQLPTELMVAQEKVASLQKELEAQRYFEGGPKGKAKLAYEAAQKDLKTTQALIKNHKAKIKAFRETGVITAIAKPPTAEPRNSIQALSSAMDELGGFETRVMAKEVKKAKLDIEKARTELAESRKGTETDGPEQQALADKFTAATKNYDQLRRTRNEQMATKKVDKMPDKESADVQRKKASNKVYMGKLSAETERLKKMLQYDKDKVVKTGQEAREALKTIEAQDGAVKYGAKRMAQIRQDLDKARVEVNRLFAKRDVEGAGAPLVQEGRAAGGLTDTPSVNEFGEARQTENIPHTMYIDKGTAKLLRELTQNSDINPAWSPAIKQAVMGYDKFINFYKANMLLPWGGTWGRNAVSNMAIAYLRGGLSMFHPEKGRDYVTVLNYVLGRYSDTPRAIGSRLGNLEEIGNKVIKAKNGRELTVKQLVEEMKIRGVFKTSISEEVLSQPSLTGRVASALSGGAAGGAVGTVAAGLASQTTDDPNMDPVLRNVLSTVGVLTGAALGARTLKGRKKMVDQATAMIQSGWKPFLRKGEMATETPIRLMTFINEFRESGSLGEAGHQVARHLNDWGSMGVFERRFLRRAIPFYSWTKLAVRQTAFTMFEHPERLSGIMKGVRDWNTSMHVDPEDVPDFLHNKLVMVGNMTDQEENNWLISGVGLPVEDVADLGNVLLPGTRDANLETRQLFDGALRRTSFPVATMIEAMANRDSFTGEAIVPDADNAIFTTKFQDGENWDTSPVWLQQLVGYKAARSAHTRGGEEVTLSKATVNPRMAWLLGEIPVSRFINLTKQVYEADGSLDIPSLTRTFLGPSAYKWDPEQGRFFRNKGRIEGMKNLLASVGALRTYQGFVDMTDKDKDFSVSKNRNSRSR